MRAIEIILSIMSFTAMISNLIFNILISKKIEYNLKLYDIQLRDRLGND